MLCEVCKKNEATVYYSENINGRVRKMSLCESCAADAEKKGDIDLGFDTPFAFPPMPSIGVSNPLGSLFSSLFGSRENGRLGTGSKDAEKCPLCGDTFEDIIREGVIGCPKCYEVFGSRLAGTVKGIHGNVQHTGHAPKQFAEKRERQNKVSELNAKLKAAVDAQEFEEAAKLRDEIKALAE